MFEDLQYLLKPKYHALWADYCCYLELGWQHFNDANRTTATKYEQLRLLETAIRRDFPLKENLLARLQRHFVAENLSLYLLLDPLSAWHYAASGKTPESETALTEIVQRAVAPAARLLMVLNDENPSTYLPMTSFLTALFLERLQTQKSPLLQSVKRSKKQWCRKYDGLLKNAFVLLGIVSSKRLKFKLATVLNTMKVQIGKILNNKQPTAELLDRVKIFWYAVFQFITVRRRTTTQKGL